MKIAFWKWKKLMAGEFYGLMRNGPSVHLCAVSSLTVMAMLVVKK